MSHTLEYQLKLWNWWKNLNRKSVLSCERRDVSASSRLSQLRSVDYFANNIQVSEKAVLASFPDNNDSGDSSESSSGPM
jgi:hypothetical protein